MRLASGARVVAAFGCMAVAGIAAAPGLAGASAAAPALRVEVFAAAPAGASKPDDLTRLGELTYVTYQNNAGKDGTPAGSHSTIVAFTLAGKVAATYRVPGRCDGLTGDPSNNRILATANEDLNSSLYVIKPGVPTPVRYVYSPSPAQKGSDGTNGGTDAVSIGTDGTIYVAHSNPDPKLPAPNNTAAVYTMKLSPGIAHLTPLYGVNDTARVINPHKGAPAMARLGLTDPDSNRIVAAEAGDTLIQTAQADSKLVFATHLHDAKPALRQLQLRNAGSTASSPTPQLDDLVQVTGPGTLYAVDQGGGKIYAIDTASLTPGTLIVSQPKPSHGDLPNTPDLGVLDPVTGIVTRLHAQLTSPKGLLFLPAASTPRTTPGGGTPTAVPAGSGGQAASTSPGAIREQLLLGGLGVSLLMIAIGGLTHRRREQRQ